MVTPAATEAPKRRGSGCLAWGCGILGVLLLCAGIAGYVWYTRQVKPWLDEKKETLGQLSAALSPDAGLLAELNSLSQNGAVAGDTDPSAFPEPGLIPSFAEDPAFSTSAPDEAVAFFHTALPSEAVIRELQDLGEVAGFTVSEQPRDGPGPARTLTLSRERRQVRIDVVDTELAPGVDVFLSVSAATEEPDAGPVDDAAPAAPGETP